MIKTTLILGGVLLLLLAVCFSCATTASGTVKEIGALEAFREYPFESQTTYIVRQGDSLSSIAKAKGISLGVLIVSNDIKSAMDLKEGTSLNIPGITSLTIGNGVTKIEQSAFANCTSLISVTIPKSRHFALNNSSKV